MQKGFAPILIIVGVLLLTLVTGGAYYLGRQTTPKSSPIIVSQNPQPSSIPDETANWKTYTNIKYGFTFKYPDSSWKADELPNPITGEYLYFHAFCNTNNDACSGNMTNFGVTIVPYKSLEEYLSAAINKIPDYERFQFNGLQAIKAVNPGTCTPTRSFQCDLPVYEIFVVNNNQGFIISEVFKGVTYANKLSQFPKTNPDILSTFKFTN